MTFYIIATIVLAAAAQGAIISSDEVSTCTI
jgi:hypothetical protein